jgi:hypothetical protein
MYQEPEEQSGGFKLFSVVYVLVLIALAFFAAGLVMSNWDLYDLLGLNTFTIPGIDKPASDIPEIVIQLVLTGILFFILQFLTVPIVSIFTKEEDEYERAFREQKRRR